MKRLLVILTLLSLLPALLLAYTDSYSEYDNNTDWNALYSAIKNNRGRSEVESLYETYISSGIANIEIARAEYNMVRYWVDSGDTESANVHLEREKEAVDNIEVSSGVLYDISMADLTSAEYYITKDMFTGMENSSLTKKLYSSYPDEVYVVLMNAWRLIYTPQIAGGSNKNAIKILLPLLEIRSSLCEQNRYSLYGALATAYYNRHDYETSREYLEEALKIYSGEKTLLELKEKLDNK